MENIRIQNALDICVIDVEGTIGVPEEWQFEEPQQRVATYEKFREAVARIEELKAEQVVVNIRSTGGDVNDALLIYDALRSLPAQITTRCYGYVASAATVIAQAASAGRRLISANSLYLIHKSSCSAEGNAEELSVKVELLRKSDEQLANLYARGGVLSAEEYGEMMSAESGSGRWLTASEAIEAGLADGVIDIAADVQEPVREGGVRGVWRNISERLGLKKAEVQGARVEQMPQCRHNILHDPHREFMVERSVIEMQEGQSGVMKSAVKPTEDATLSETIRSANELAYSSDAQSFVR